MLSFFQMSVPSHQPRLFCTLPDHPQTPKQSSFRLSKAWSMHQYNRVSVGDLLNENTSSSGPTSGSSSSSHRHQSSDIKCKVTGCGRSFISTRALVAHEKRSHAAPTDYVCTYCQSSFSTSPNLNKHIRSVHNKLKPFTCELCNTSFGFKDGLERHVAMVHEQLRPHACTHCSLKFKTKAHLNKHLLAIHPDRSRQSPLPGTSSGHH